jgi:hypothetical protein
MKPAGVGVSPEYFFRAARVRVATRARTNGNRCIVVRQP